jgi:hypothetical protein
MTTVALTPQQQQAARNAAVAAATLALSHEPFVHYTQDSRRWQGIDQRLDASRGQYPNYADCSSFVTWCIWNGIYLPYGMEDVVNGQGWQAGYTGTMLQHGTAISRASDLLPGDAVIYGAAGSTGAHTAIVVASGSTPTVISHGSEAGPYRLAYNYRSDVQSLRRYIDGNPHQASGGTAPAPTPPPTEEPVVAISAVVKQDGRIEVFCQTEGKDQDTVWHTWQVAKNGGWTGSEKGKVTTWQNMGKLGK